MSAQEFKFYFDAPVDQQAQFDYPHHQLLEIGEMESFFMLNLSDLDAENWFKTELKLTQHHDSIHHFGSEDPFEMIAENLKETFKCYNKDQLDSLESRSIMRIENFLYEEDKERHSEIGSNVNPSIATDPETTHVYNKSGTLRK